MAHRLERLLLDFAAQIDRTGDAQLAGQARALATAASNYIPENEATTEATAEEPLSFYDQRPEFEPVHWTVICRVAYMLGIVRDFSEGECLRLHAKLIGSPTTEKISRGVYRIKRPVPGPEANTDARPK